MTCCPSDDVIASAVPDIIQEISAENIISFDHRQEQETELIESAQRNF